MKKTPVKSLAPAQLTADGMAGGATVAMDALRDVEMRISVEVGGTRIPIRDILELRSGSIVELDRLVGEPVDVLVNGHRFALGEVVVITDTFGVRITEILTPQVPHGDADRADGADVPFGAAAGATDASA
jgi:flagellar motor switch protein FliN